MSKGVNVCFDDYTCLTEGVWEKADEFFVGTSDLRKKACSFIMMTCNPGNKEGRNTSLKHSADVNESVNKSV